jgi:hypothetical protein
MAEEKSRPNFQAVLRMKPFRFMTTRLKTVGVKSKAFTARKFNFVRKFTKKKRFAIKGKMIGKALSQHTGFQSFYQVLRNRYIERLQQQFLHTDLLNKGKESIWKSMDMVFPTGGTAAPASLTPQAVQPQTESFKPFQQLEGGGMIIPPMEADPVYLEQKRRAALRAAAPKKPVLPPSARVYSRAEEISPARGKPSDTSNKAIRQEETAPHILPVPESQPAVEEIPAAPAEAPVEEVSTPAPVTPPARTVENPTLESTGPAPRLPAAPSAAAQGAPPPVHTVQRMPEKTAPPPAPPVTNPEVRQAAPRIHCVTPSSQPPKIVPPQAKPVQRMQAVPTSPPGPVRLAPVQPEIPSAEEPGSKPQQPQAPPAPIKDAAEPAGPQTQPLPVSSPVAPTPEPAIVAKGKFEATVRAPSLQASSPTVEKEPKAVEKNLSSAQPPEIVLPRRLEKQTPRRMAAKPAPQKQAEKPPLLPVQAVPPEPVKKSLLPIQSPATPPVRTPAELVTLPEGRPARSPAPVPVKAAMLPVRRPKPEELAEPEQKPGAKAIATPLLPKVQPEAMPESNGEVELPSVDLPVEAQPEMKPAEVAKPRQPLPAVTLPAVHARRAARIRLARRPTLKKPDPQPSAKSEPATPAKEQPTPSLATRVASHIQARAEQYLAIAHRKPAIRRALLAVTSQPALPDQHPVNPPAEPAPQRLNARPVAAKPISSRPTPPGLAQRLAAPAVLPAEHPASSPEMPQESHPSRQPFWRAPASPQLSAARQIPAGTTPIHPAGQTARLQDLPQPNPVRRMAARPVRVLQEPESVPLPVPLADMPVPPRPAGQVQVNRNLSQQVRQKYLPSQPAAPAPAQVSSPAPAAVSAGTVQRQMETRKTSPKPPLAMPVVHAHPPAEVSGVVQRALDKPATLPAAPEEALPPPAEENKDQQPPLNISQIADQVYPILIRRLEIEKERHAGKFW